MKILFLIGSLGGGGAEKVACDLANEWSKTREVYIYLFEGRLENEYDISDKVIIIPSKTKGLFKQSVELRKIKKQYGIDFSMAFSIYTGVLNALTKGKDKTVNGVHATYSKSPNAKKKKMYVSFSNRMVDKVVPVSKASVRDQMSYYKIPAKKLVNIYNPCNLSLIEQKKQEELSDEFFQGLKDAGKKIIISHGRLSEEKCQNRMIRAMKLIAKNETDAVLVIMGQGPLEDYLKQLIADYQLEDKVYLLGFQPNPYKYLIRSDLYIFASAYEGFPIAPLDAMSCGLPIVASQGQCGVRELIAPSTDCLAQCSQVEYAQYGVLTPSFDDSLVSTNDEMTREEEIFAEAIVNVLGNKELSEKYSKMSLERIQDFTPERIVEQWEQLIQTL